MERHLIDLYQLQRDMDTTINGKKEKRVVVIDKMSSTALLTNDKRRYSLTVCRGIKMLKLFLEVHYRLLKQKSFFITMTSRKGHRRTHNAT